MKTVARGLRARDRDLRSQAIEALESMADRRVSRGMIALLEGGGGSAPAAPRGQALAALGRHPRPWFRALALRAQADGKPQDRGEIARLARVDPSVVVQQAVMVPNGHRSGVTGVETAQTLGIVERVLFLRQVPIFRRLEPEDLESIARLAREHLYPAGERLCQEGELGDELYVLVEGTVEVSKQREGRSHSLRTLQAGQHLGELAILREQPRSASAHAVSETRCLVLSGDALRSILEDRPEVGLALLESLAEQLGTAG
jgi:hypothetical protein